MVVDTADIPVSSAAREDSGASVNDELALDSLAPALMGIELGALGAIGDIPAQMQPEIGAMGVNWPRLRSSVTAAHDGGLDFVSIDHRFLLTSESTAVDAMLDPARAGARLAPVSTAGVFVEVPPAPKLINSGIDLLAHQDKGWAGILMPLNDQSDFVALREAADRGRALGMRFGVIIGEPALIAGRAQIVAGIADTIQLRTDSLEDARTARFILKEAAEKFGHDMTVFATHGVVISASGAAARERANLVEAMHGEPLFAECLHTYGTLYDVADMIQRWISVGAADGMWFLPASLPSDEASVIKGVIPLLRARREKLF